MSISPKELNDTQRTYTDLFHGLRNDWNTVLTVNMMGVHLGDEKAREAFRSNLMFQFIRSRLEDVKRLGECYRILVEEGIIKEAE